MLRLFYPTGILFYCITYMSAQDQAACNFSLTLAKEDSSQIRVTRLKSNSPQTDFSPFFHQGTLYFVSGRYVKGAVEYKDVSGNNEITDIYAVTMRDSIRTGKPQPLPGNINTKYYEGPFTFSADMQKMYYSLNDKKSALQKIYSANFENNKWRPLDMLPFCEDTFSYCHPALTNDQKTIWFSSNRPGGKGGMDLYYSELKNGEWQKPVNAGGQINTTANDVFPFVSGDRIYFASDRPGGIGGLDIYKAQKTGNKFVTELLPHPFNSAFDDFSIWTDNNNQQGYFSSNRSSNHSDDIYHFASMLPDVKAAVSYTPKTKFCYTFYEENPDQLQDSVEYEFEWTFGDGEKGKGIKTRHCFQKPGAYKVELNIVQRVSGEVFNSQAAYDLVVDTPSAFNIVTREQVTAGSCIDLSCHIQGLKGFMLEEAYWSFGDGRFNTSKEVSHIYRKPGEYVLLVYGIARNREEKKELKLKAEKKIIVNP